MEHGTAYFLHRDLEDAGLVKSWELLDGRRFLIERIAYEQVAPLLEKLPLRTSWPEAEELGRRTTVGRAGFAGLVPRRGRGVELAMAAGGSPASAQGVVLDYVTLNSSQTNYTFRGDMTYRIVGSVYLYGTTILEGGSVIKFDQGSTHRLYSQSGWVDCRTHPYRPAISTAKDDNSAGATISGSTGSPSGPYAEYALFCSGPTGPLTLEHLQVRHANFGMLFLSGGGHTHTVRHVQFVDCQRPIYGHNSTLKAQNLLMSRVGIEAFHLGSGVSAAGEHVTIHRADRVVHPQNVQEQGMAWGSGSQVVPNAGSPGPELRLRFTECSPLPGMAGSIFGSGEAPRRSVRSGGRLPERSAGPVLLPRHGRRIEPDQPDQHRQPAGLSGRPLPLHDHDQSGQGSHQPGGHRPPLRGPGRHRPAGRHRRRRHPRLPRGWQRQREL
jgi:hypothetical protein